MRTRARRRGVVDDALVDALVPPASEDQVRFVGELACHRLREQLSSRRWEDHDGVAASRMPSSASPHGSGFITMPAPPPYGVSSTVR